jgi:hypothetical protein
MNYIPVTYFYYSFTTKTGCIFFASNYSLVIPRPNRKDDCTYGIFTYPTLKYDRRDIQSKAFDGSTCIPTLYRLLKNCASR